MPLPPGPLEPQVEIAKRAGERDLSDIRSANGGRISLKRRERAVDFALLKGDRVGIPQFGPARRRLVPDK